jgi:prolyl oligopeptidase
MREGWTGPEKLLFDPSHYQPGTTTTIQSTVPSFDGRFVALGLSSRGAEWSEIRILDVDQATLLPERIYPSRGVFSWTPDGRGFFYDSGKVTDLRALDLKLNREVRLHLLGRPLAEDRVVLSAATNPELGITPKEIPGVFVSQFHPELLLGWADTVQKDLRVFCVPLADLGEKRVPWRVLGERSDCLTDWTDGLDGLYAVTYAGAPHGKVVRTSLERPDWSRAETVVPETANTIEYTIRSKSYLFIVSTNGLTGQIRKMNLTSGRIEAVPLPLAGDVGVAVPDAATDHCLIGVTSWTRPLTRFDYDATTGAIARSPFSTDRTYPEFEALVAEEVEAPAQDGTLVPLSIIHRKGLPLNGTSRCILTGYGAYGARQTPHFEETWSLALRDVVLAIAHVRGGGEKGDEWYRAGFKTTKPNTWNDFIACAEYLAKHGYTSPDRLACTGRSAGGILVSRAVTERPDLFAAAVCNVGCANAMRMEFSPNGPVNIPEFGTVKDPVECAALYVMDGLQHVRKGVNYPALMGVTGWNDPRVAPWEPGKFVAAVQNASTAGRPALLKVNYDSGHRTLEKDVRFKDLAGQYAFLLWQTGHPDFQPQ